jgi:hypothetical protein
MLSENGKRKESTQGKNQSQTRPQLMSHFISLEPRSSFLVTALQVFIPKRSFEMRLTLQRRRDSLLLLGQRRQRLPSCLITIAHEGSYSQEEWEAGKQKVRRTHHGVNA